VGLEATARCANGGGAAADRVLQLHSRWIRQAEAVRWAESVEVGESFGYVGAGFGLGHHLKALRQVKGDVFLTYWSGICRC